MRLEDLDQRQRAVVDAVISSDDRVLVLGGAGTGKTTTALWAARNLSGDIIGNTIAARAVPHVLPCSGKPNRKPLARRAVRLQQSN